MASCLVQAENSGTPKQHNLAQNMENNNVVADTAAPVVPIRRTAAIDVLTRALQSPPIEGEGLEAATANASAAAAARSFLDTTSSVYVLDNSMIGPNSATIATMSPTNSLGSNNNSNNEGDASGNENMPKIFGCWNFLHQAMNEIERFEDEQNHLAASNRRAQPTLLAETRLLAEFAVKVSRRSDELDRQKVATCVENFCSSSRSIVAPGKENASNDASSDTNNDSAPKGRLDANKTDEASHDIRVLLPQLVRSNAEIREIVTGRIAAFSFNGVAHAAGTTPTAFADPLVVETFCRFLAANAVSNGAESLGRFLNDWIIPAATVDPAIDPAKRQRLEGSPKRLLTHRLPPYSLACVLYHVAAEAETIREDDSLEDASTSRTISPLGTIDVLQKLSLPVMANVLLGPVLHDALQRKQLQRQLRQHRQTLQQPETPQEEDDMDDRIISMGLRAVLKWCKTTDLSLAQCKHIGSKVRLNLSRLLGEVLQTECPNVMIALADLIEDVVERHIVPQRPQTERLISDSRMTQTRYLMQVPDEASFRANVSQEQLHTIETKELADILTELSADVERQRFRFPSFGREAAKDKESAAKKSLHGEALLDNAIHSLGHSLARIVAALCSGYAKVVHPETSAPYQIPPGPGMMELLSKCASHPSVSICGLILPVITPMLKTQVHLATQWLPTLQRRAIIPHHPNNIAILSPTSGTKIDSSDESYIPLLVASDICFVEFEEFVDRFRETVLADALKACYSIHSEYYLASCTAAIEEFCVGDAVTEQTSFHLEAALFCLAVVAEQVLSGVIPDARATSPNPATKINANIPDYLLRCTAALAKKPKSLNNPLTMIQVCRFIRNYAKWFGSNQHPGILDISADLTLHILVQCATSFKETPLSSTVLEETGVTPYSDAAKTLRSLLCNNAKHFLSNKAIAALGAGWEATFAACNLGGKLLTLDDRKETCIGICHVLAALPADQQQTSLMALALASIACLEAMVERAESVGTTGDEKKLTPILDRAADEIQILVTTARAFTEAISTNNSGNESGRTAFVEPSMMVLGRAWPTISTVASKYSFHDSILESLRFLFIECTAQSYTSEISLTFLQKMCALAQIVITNETARQKNSKFFLPVLSFLDNFVESHGGTFESIVVNKSSSGSDTESTIKPIDKTTFQCVDSLARETIQAMTSLNLLGRGWTSDQTQAKSQSAKETKYKQPLPHKRASFSSSGLAPFFSFLRTCILNCPAFLLHVLAFEGPDGHDDHNINDAPDLLMLRKVLGSAVSAIIDVEAEISVQAMSFLVSVVSLAAAAKKSDATNNTAIRTVTAEYNLPFQTSMISTLLRGTCGLLQPFVIPHACCLLFDALSKSSLNEEEFKVIVLRGLSQEHFFLGNRARIIVFEHCLELLKNSDTAPSLEKFETMMTGMWRLHRFEDIDMIERSDAVHAFCIQHGSKKRKTSGLP